MDPITAIIADDEPLAREGLQLRLQHEPALQIVSQCADGNSAVSAIEQHHPQVVFLDIEMPGLNGVGVLRELHRRGIELPFVVFITAYKDFALEAFEQQASDYLLKPYTDERLQQCLQHARAHIKQQAALCQQEKLEGLLSRRMGRSLSGFIDNLERQPQATMQNLSETISLKSGTEWHCIRLEDIQWIEAAGDYMCVHTQTQPVIIRKTLLELERELDRQRFPRVSRSAIINLSKVKRLKPNSNGEYLADLENGDQVKISRKYRLTLEDLGLLG